MWSRGKWFIAHVIAVRETQYDLYFPDDGQEKLDVPSYRVKKCPMSKCGIPVHTRGEMLKRVFYDDGKGKDETDNIPEGMWLVRSVRGNEYVCVRSPDCRNKDAIPNVMNFDIGHVIRVVTAEEQRVRNTF